MSTQGHIFPAAVLSMAKTEKNPDVHQWMNEQTEMLSIPTVKYELAVK